MSASSKARLVLLAMIAVGVAVIIASAWLLGRPQWQAYQMVQARQQTNSYELAVAGDGDPAKAPRELVAILGDSRLRHWNRVNFVVFARDGSVASHGTDRRLRFWNAASGKQTQSPPPQAKFPIGITTLLANPDYGSPMQ